MTDAFYYIAGSIASNRWQDKDDYDGLAGKTYAELWEQHMGEFKKELDGRGVPEQVAEDIEKIA